MAVLVEFDLATKQTNGPQLIATAQKGNDVSRNSVNETPQTTQVSHTPGPWKLNGSHRCDDPRIFSGDGVLCLALLTGGLDGEANNGPTTIANGHLMAAAPGLLEACQAALNWSALDGDGISEPVRSQLIAAIADAEGR